LRNVAIQNEKASAWYDYLENMLDGKFTLLKAVTPELLRDIGELRIAAWEAAAIVSACGGQCLDRPS